MIDPLLPDDGTSMRLEVRASVFRGGNVAVETNARDILSSPERWGTATGLQTSTRQPSNRAADGGTEDR